MLLNGRANSGILQQVFLITILTFSCYPNLLKAQHSSQITIIYGTPTTQQNMEISNLDIIIDNSLFKPSLNSDFGFNLRAGQLNLNGETAGRIGLGSYLKQRFGPLNISIPAGLIWLEKCVFGKDQWHTKNYGGKLRFFYGAELSVALNDGWHLSYRFEHMSNGDRYESNPALDSHNLGISKNL